MDHGGPQSVYKVLFTSDALVERITRFHLPTIDVILDRCPENWTA